MEEPLIPHIEQPGQFTMHGHMTRERYTEARAETAVAKYTTQCSIDTLTMVIETTYSVEYASKKSRFTLQ